MLGKLVFIIQDKHAKSKKDEREDGDDQGEGGLKSKSKLSRSDKDGKKGSKQDDKKADGGIDGGHEGVKKRYTWRGGRHQAKNNIDNTFTTSQGFMSPMNTVRIDST